VALVGDYPGQTVTRRLRLPVAPNCEERVYGECGAYWSEARNGEEGFSAEEFEGLERRLGFVSILSENFERVVGFEKSIKEEL
jgi:hypothetical protein